MITESRCSSSSSSSSDALTRMKQFKSSGEGAQADSRALGRVRLLFIVASVLSFVGGCLSLCAMVLVIAPDSEFASLITSACTLAL